MRWFGWFRKKEARVSIETLGKVLDVLCDPEQPDNSKELCSDCEYYVVADQFPKKAQYRYSQCRFNKSPVDGEDDLHYCQHERIFGSCRAEGLNFKRKK